MGVREIKNLVFGLSIPLKTVSDHVNPSSFEVHSASSPEYVLAIQRKIIVEKVKAEKEAKKAELNKKN